MAASAWHVTGPKEFYLYGTIHVFPPGDGTLPAVFNDTFEQCDNLWLEADLNSLQNPDVAMQARNIMLLPNGETLQSTLSEQALANMQLLANEAGIPLLVVQGLKPWAAINVLTLAVFQQRGFNVEQGVDLVLYDMASQKNIPVHSFETVMWQLELFDQMGEDYGERYIEFSTNELNQADQMLNEMASYWREGNVEGLYQQADFSQYPEVEQDMLTKRNNAWMATLLSLEDSLTNCVAVGALHMAAEHGLIAQFERAGYQVTQLK